MAKHETVTKEGGYNLAWTKKYKTLLLFEILSQNVFLSNENNPSYRKQIPFFITTDLTDEMGYFLPRHLL